MTSPYYNTNVQRILKFDDLTDEEVREITKYPFTKKRFDCNSLDEWLEGQDGYKDGGKFGMGRLTLPYAVLNLNTLYAPNANLVKVTGISRNDLLSLVLFAKAYIAKSSNPNYEEGSIVPLPPNQPSIVEEGVTAYTGTDAIRSILTKKGVSVDRYLMTEIPIPPYEIYQKDGFWTDPFFLCQRVAGRAERLQRLLNLGAPQIILNNEKRMTQEAVFQMISNGVIGRFITDGDGYPLCSYYEISEMLDENSTIRSAFSHVWPMPASDETIEKLNQTANDIQKDEEIPEDTLKTIETEVKAVTDRYMQEHYAGYEDFHHNAWEKVRLTLENKLNHELKSYEGFAYFCMSGIPDLLALYFAKCTPYEEEEQ